MYTVTPRLYEIAARNLLDAIDDRHYFSGSVSFTFEDAECRLTASLIIYRKHCEMPEGVRTVIDDIVPVWWEFSTEGNEGEMLNDFSFGELKEYIF